MLKDIWLRKTAGYFQILKFLIWHLKEIYICSIEYGTNDLMFRCLKISFLSLMKYAVNA